MDDKTEKKRRPKGQAALGDLHITKIVVDDLLLKQSEERKRKTERLRALRLGGQTVPDDKGLGGGG
jgi:hypothetical protein